MGSAQISNGATYYVTPSGNDSSNGSSSSPFRTIQRAANVVNPGDTVIIRNGTYTGDSNSVADIGRSGTSNAWITFRAENKWGAILDGRNNSTQHGLILESGLGYVRFEGLQIQGTISGGFSASENTHDIVYYNNLLHDIGRNCTDTSGGQVGFRDKESSARFVYDSNVLHTIGRLRPNEGCNNLSTTNYKNHDHGMYLRGSNIRIINNVFYNIRSGWSIQSADGADNWVIANNTFAFPNPDREGHIVLWESNNSIVVANNIFYQPQDAAVRVNPCSDKSNIVMRNNISTAQIMIDTNTDNYSCGAVSQSNNRANTNPGLVNPGQNNFQLTSSSPAINQADPGTSPSSDHNGAPRPAGGGYDVGAFEYGSSGSSNDSSSPTVSISNPSPGGTVSGNVTIVALASDNVGVLGVQFQVNGSNVGGEDTTNDYSVVWDTSNVPNGVVVISATARDAAGNLGTTALTVNVNNQTAPPPTPAPTLSINASPSSIQSGQGSTLSWSSSNATSCSASGSWGGSKPLNGSQGVQPTSNATYTMTCTGNGGSVTRSASISVSQPTNNPPSNDPPSNDGTLDIQLSSSASTVRPGSTVSLSWLARNATTCYAWGGWRGSRPVQGNESMRVYSDTRFTLGCSGTSGGTSKTVMVRVSDSAAPTQPTSPPPAQAPTLNLFASPTSIQQGQTTTLSWASANASSCSASGSWGGGKPTSGNQTLQPSSSGSYTLTCSGAGGTISRTVSVSVAANQPPPAPAPSLSINASPSSIQQGQNTFVSWTSSNATSCSASGSWGGGKPTSGSQSMQPSSNATYRLTCNGPGGSITRSASVSVAANNPPPSSPPPPSSDGTPSLNFSASSTSVRSGQAVTLSWSSQNTSICIGSGGWSGTKSLSGSQIVRPSQTAVYILGCSGPGGGVSRVVRINVQ